MNSSPRGGEGHGLDVVELKMTVPVAGDQLADVLLFRPTTAERPRALPILDVGAAAGNRRVSQ